MRMVLNDEVIREGHWMEDRLEGEIKMAFKTLQVWASYGGVVFGEVYVLVGGSEVKTILKSG